MPTQRTASLADALILLTAAAPRGLAINRAVEPGAVMPGGFQRPPTVGE